MYKTLLHRLLGRLRFGSLRLVENGKTRTFGDSASSLEATIEVLDGAFYQSVVRRGEAGLGRAYTAGYWTSPDLEAVTLVLNVNVAAFRAAITGGTFLLQASRFAHRLGQSVLANRKRSTKEQSTEGMSVAYDVGEEFFRLMLGPSMLYSCALFPHSEATLDEAQEHKLDLLIEKLAPEPGQTVLDIGCGWGTLLEAIRRRHGCDVHGISLAQKQIDYCRLTHPEGRFDLLDYRDLEGEAVYDRIVSVGMIEHVGPEWHETFMAVVARLLKPGGRAVLHTMIEGDVLNFDDGEHIDSYAADTIMPVSYIPSSRELRRAINRITLRSSIAGDATPHGLYPVHDERFGQHYGKTMRCWRRNVLDHRDEIVGMYSEEHARIYDYVWAMCSSCFLSSNFDLMQLVVEKGELDGNVRVYDPRHLAGAS